MKAKFAVLALVLSFQAVTFQAAADEAFPTGPNPDLTPGSLCAHADQVRYPENISYCERDVDSPLKKRIIREYDQKLGYHIQSMNRQDFKIDHFIPLCAGGSNNSDNLWPQHKSVYEITDPLEPLVCEKMAQGKLMQEEAVHLIREAKLDLSKVDAIIAELEAR